MLFNALGEFWFLFQNARFSLRRCLKCVGEKFPGIRENNREFLKFWEEVLENHEGVETAHDDLPYAGF